MVNEELNVLWRRDFFPSPYLSAAVTGRAFISEPPKLSHDPWILQVISPTPLGHANFMEAELLT